jgi:adenosylcobinamide amidohydrolase
MSLLMEALRKAEEAKRRAAANQQPTEALSGAGTATDTDQPLKLKDQEPVTIQSSPPAPDQNPERLLICHP